MGHLTEVTFSCITTDRGDKTFKVVARQGDPENMPDSSELHHSHYPEVALKSMRDATKAAVSQSFDRITVPKRTL